MKKWIIILLVFVALYLVGCSADEEVSSLNDYDMVEGIEWQFEPVSNHKEINIIYG